MTRRIFTGPLGQAGRELWRLSRASRTHKRLLRLDSSAGLLAWGHPWDTQIIVSLMALGFASASWFLGGRRFDAGLWPLWAMAGVFAAVGLANLAFHERFTLDIQRRRWRYRRGWFGKAGVEEGPFKDLAGITLEEYRRPALNGGTIWHLSVDFADGVRFVTIENPWYSGEEEAARAEARRVADASGLPLTIKPLED